MGIGTNTPSYPLTIDSRRREPVRASSNYPGARVINAISSAISGPGWGVYGMTSSQDAGAYGVVGYASGGAGSGVRGINTSATGYGVYSDGNSFVHGNAYVSGSKPAVVPTSQGNRLLYCIESPEVWFEDTGEGQLAGGLAHIDLDALFLETVTIDDQHPMRVFVQLNDDCNGVYVQRQATGFQVMELGGGNSSAHFTYRVMAKRKGFENARLEAAPDASKSAALTAPLKVAKN